MVDRTATDLKMFVTRHNLYGNNKWLSRSSLQVMSEVVQVKSAKCLLLPRQKTKFQKSHSEFTNVA